MAVVSEKHMEAATLVASTIHFLSASYREAGVKEIAAALAIAEREGMKRAAAFVLFHNNGSNKWREVASSLSQGISLCPDCDGQGLMHGYDCDCPTCRGTGFARTPPSEAGDS